jgi:hypothetical protein
MLFTMLTTHPTAVELKQQSQKQFTEIRQSKTPALGKLQNRRGGSAKLQPLVYVPLEKYQFEAVDEGQANLQAYCLRASWYPCEKGQVTATPRCQAGPDMNVHSVPANALNQIIHIHP